VFPQKVSFYFLFFSWLASRLGLDYEALGNESLNCVTLVEAPPGSSPCEYESFNYFFHFSFGLHQGLGQIMKFSITRAWILWLWVEAVPSSWPSECEMFDYLSSFFFWLAPRLGPDYEALGNESLNCVTVVWSSSKQLVLWVWKVWLYSFHFLFALHQGLGLIMKLSVMGAWIVWLWVEAPLGSWLCEWEKFDFILFIFFLPYIKVRPDYEALGNRSLNCVTLGFSYTRQLAQWMRNVFFFFWFFFWVASRLGPDYEALGNENLNFVTLGCSCTRQLAQWVWNVWIFFSFFFWLASRLGSDYEALGNESLNFETLAWCWIGGRPFVWEKFDFFLHIFFGMHQGLGLIMKLLVTRACIVWLWFEAAVGNWPCECEKFHFFYFLFLAWIMAWAWLWSSR
jgi:hypothetical protein